MGELLSLRNMHVSGLRAKAVRHAALRERATAKLREREEDTAQRRHRRRSGGTDGERPKASASLMRRVATRAAIDWSADTASDMVRDATAGTRRTSPTDKTRGGKRASGDVRSSSRSAARAGRRGHQCRCW